MPVLDFWNYLLRLGYPRQHVTEVRNVFKKYKTTLFKKDEFSKETFTWLLQHNWIQVGAVNIENIPIYQFTDFNDIINSYEKELKSDFARQRHMISRARETLDDEYKEIKEQKVRGRKRKGSPGRKKQNFENLIR